MVSRMQFEMTTFLLAIVGLLAGVLGTWFFRRTLRGPRLVLDRDDSGVALSAEGRLYKIRRALPSEAAALSALAFEAKALWPYTPAQLALWRDELTVLPATIATHATYVAEMEKTIVGFFVLERALPHWRLEHLWVSPSRVGLGVGRALLAYASSLAAQGGSTAIAIDADPNAEAFYLECDASRVGTVAAPIEGAPDRVRPQLLLATKPTGGTPRAQVMKKLD